MKKTCSLILTAFAFAVFVFLSACEYEPITSIKTFDGVNVSFDNEGKGDPAIIMIHGWSNTKDIWEIRIENILTT